MWRCTITFESISKLKPLKSGCFVVLKKKKNYFVHKMHVQVYFVSKKTNLKMLFLFNLIPAEETVGFALKKWHHIFFHLNLAPPAQCSAIQIQYQIHRKGMYLVLCQCWKSQIMTRFSSSSWKTAWRWWILSLGAEFPPATRKHMNFYCKSLAIIHTPLFIIQ